MNKISKLLLAILGGFNVAFEMFSPIILAALWISVSPYASMDGLVMTLGFMASLFRGIKFILGNKER